MLNRVQWKTWSWKNWSCKPYFLPQLPMMQIAQDSTWMWWIWSTYTLTFLLRMHIFTKKRFKLADKIYVTYTNLLLLKSRHGVNVAAQWRKTKNTLWLSKLLKCFWKRIDLTKFLRENHFDRVWQTDSAAKSPYPESLFHEILFKRE